MTPLDKDIRMLRMLRQLLKQRAEAREDLLVFMAERGRSADEEDIRIGRALWLQLEHFDAAIRLAQEEEGS